MVKRIDYTTKDYYGYMADMVELIPSKLPEWTDRSPNDAGIVILELLAHQLEKGSYYNDRIANEVFLSTATQRRSVINQCRLIGYELSWQTSAKHWQVFEIIPQPEDVVIPKGTLLGTRATGGEESIIFETLEDLVIPANATGLEKDEYDEYLYRVEVEHGQTIFDEYLGAVTTTDVGQEFKLMYSPVLKDSITVFVSDFNGKRKWERVADFIGSGLDSMHYKVDMDEFDTVHVQFGNGASGMIPTVASQIFADYKVGGGKEGNVGANTITEAYDSIIGLVSTFNPYGYHIAGNDKESLEEAKFNGPASLRRLDRYVTLEDYQVGVLLDFKAIAKAKAINDEGVVNLYILPKDGFQASQALKDEILRIIEQKKVIFTPVQLHDPNFAEFNLTVNLSMYSNYDPEVIRFMAINMLTDLYAIENIDFGTDVKLAEIYHVLLDIEGVSNARITSPTVDILTDDATIPRLRTLTVLVNGQ